MKRILLRQPLKKADVKRNINDDSELWDISKFISELRLLYEVPFSYLVPDEFLLPPESIRFFTLDENWLNALTDGAMSIGRIARHDVENDNNYFSVIAEEATRVLGDKRFRDMHENHRRFKHSKDTAGKARTGFILRSELVGKWKGLEAFGYSDENELNILRMEALSNEILIAVFDGVLTKFVVSEPKTGLRFGAPDNTGEIILRSINDNSEFGTPLANLKINLNDYKEANGRLKVSALADDIQIKLKSPIGSPELAFELIAVAKRAEFLKGEN